MTRYLPGVALRLTGTVPLNSPAALVVTLSIRAVTLLWGRPTSSVTTLWLPQWRPTRATWSPRCVVVGLTDSVGPVAAVAADAHSAAARARGRTRLRGDMQRSSHTSASAPAL